ncbi:unnamed protein product [Didymodactylos carnosus]|uniref:Actin interacting protein 3-like C-terminal domain-containing protein n=1 Tax=Didymodactylos carnosus TaxID=1234261 RepID=A0A813UJ29_9BILA|nr:unnamed protein product [Didymodactylos carnosus]CAF0827757.1 unnamed protein product [Didymodactylos carnosus]CAF3569962.1 unnamed protein product [Didymodactylos carnosus]CAF3614656.1 unnamed protein product [Didymodactylos carnosus]
MGVKEEFTDSPSTATTRKLKPNGHIDTNGDIHKKVYSNNRTKTNNYQPLTTPSRSTNTVNGSVKRNIADYSEMERNICAEPPASVKQSHTNGYKSPLTIIQGVPPSNNPRSSVLPTTVNGTNHYLPIIRRTEQQQQTPSKIKTTLTNRKYYTNSDHRCNSSRSLVSSPISNTSSTNSFSAASESTNVSININNNNCVSDHGTSSEGNHSRQKNYSPLDIHHYHRNNSTDLMTKSESACTILYNNDEKESNSKNTKSKSTYDIESLNYCNMTNDCAVGRKTFTIQNNTNQILLDNDNNRPLSRTKDNLNVAKTCFTPLEVVKEDECLEVEPKYMIDTKYNDNDVEHQLCQQQKNSLINIIKQRYANRTEHPASVSTTPTMPRAQSPTRRPSSTGPYDDEIYTTKMATTTTNFARGHRTRTSLPVIVRPATNKTNSLGLCFLCVGDETKKVLLPNEVTCTDTVKALFVRAFPHHLSMKYMDQDTVRIYVKDPERDLFYQLEDISDVKDRCVLKVVQLKTCALINESESPCTIDGRLSVFDNNHISTSSLTSTKPLCASIATNVKSKDQDDIYVPFTSRPILASEITYQRLSRLGRVPSSTSITGLQTTNSTRNSIDENKIATAQVAATTITTTNSRSLSEPRRRIQNNSNDKEQDRIIGSETILSHNRTTMFPEKISPKSTALPYENGYAFSRSGSTTPRLTDDDARCKMEYMEKQLESLTDFVQALSRSNETNERSNSFNNCNALFKNDGKSLRQSLYELKIKTHALKNDLNLLKRLQQTMQDNMRNQFQMASKRIQDQLLKYQIENKVERRTVETELDNYIISSAKIDRELEDLEATVEDLRNDVMSNKNCHVTMNDVESFALALSTISRSLVDLKGKHLCLINLMSFQHIVCVSASFPVLREKICCLGLQSTLKDDEKFLREEPERLDFTIKRCKRLTTMLYNLKRLAVGQEQKKIKVKAIVIQSSFNFDKKALNNEIESATQNSDGRLKAIEKAEKSRERRLYYANQLDSLKQLKYNDEQQHQNNENSRDSIQSFDNRSLNNSILLTSSARTSICSNQSSSTDTNNCPSPSLSFMVRQAVITPTQASTDTNMTINTNLSTSSNSSSESNNRLLINHSRSQLTSKQNKVTFSNELVTNGKKTLTNGSSYPSSRDHSQDSITTKFTQFQCSSPLVTTHMNNKRKPMPPPRVESNSHPTNKTISYQLLSSSSSSAVSSSSSTSSGSSTSQKNGYNHHQSNIKCFSTKPISLSPQECRQNGRCNSYSSSSTDTDSVISNPNISHLPSHTVTNGTNIIKRSPVSNQLLKSLPPCNGGFYTNQQSNNNKFDSIITDYSKKLMRTSVTEL